MLKYLLFFWLFCLADYVVANPTVNDTIKHSKLFRHSLHFGFERIYFNRIEVTYRTNWESFVFEYDLKYRIRKDISISAGIGFFYSQNDRKALGQPFKSLRFSLKTGIKNKYYLKFQRINSIIVDFKSFSPVEGYITSRDYSISDFVFSYAFPFVRKKDQQLEIGTGITISNGNESYIVGCGMHSGGWLECMGDGRIINKTGYAVEINYFIKPISHVSCRAFVINRIYRKISSTFSYGIFLGYSF